MNTVSSNPFRAALLLLTLIGCQNERGTSSATRQLGTSTQSVSMAAQADAKLDGQSSHLAGHPKRAVRPEDTPVITTGAADEEVVVQGLATFPDETVEDWVSFADQVAIVKVLSERRLPGLRNRHTIHWRGVQLEVKESLWARDDRPRLRERARLEIKAFGWATVKGGERKARQGHSARLEMSGEYIMPLFFDGGVWEPLSFGSVIPVEGSDVAEADGSKGQCDNPVGIQLTSMSRGQQKRFLKLARPHAEVVPLLHLPPLARIEAVRQAGDQALDPPEPQVPVPEEIIDAVP